MYRSHRAGLALAAAVFVAGVGWAPAAAAHGDNCSYAGTKPPVPAPTGVPGLPHGWHWPCTSPTPRPPTPKPPPEPPKPTPPPPSPAPPKPAPPPPVTTPPAPPPPRPAPPRPAPPRPAPPKPAPPTPPPTTEPPKPTPSLTPRSYAISSKPPENGRSLVTNMLLLTAPAVLAAAALRPRGSSSSRGRS